MPAVGGELPGMAQSILRRKSSHSSQRPLASAGPEHRLLSAARASAFHVASRNAELRQLPCGRQDFDLTGQTETGKSTRRHHPMKRSFSIAIMLLASRLRGRADQITSRTPTCSAHTPSTTAVAAQPATLLTAAHTGNGAAKTTDPLPTVHSLGPGCREPLRPNHHHCRWQS